MTTFVCRFAQHWEDFRLAELDAVAQMQGAAISYDSAAHSHDSPFMKVVLTDDTAVQRILDRAILVKDFLELWAEGTSLDALHAAVHGQLHRFAAYRDTAFKFYVKSYGRTVSTSEQLAIINSFAYTDLRGPIRMADPDVVFGVFCDSGGERFYFGRYVGRSMRGRHLDCMDLKKREYLGTTSMDAELSLVMTNMGLVQRGSLVYDPFVGTGSLMYTAAYFGGYALGSDIDGRQLRGTGASSTTHRGPKYQKTAASAAPASMHANIEQYGLGPRVLDGLVFDTAHHPWSPRLTLTAIITDPPYGVRAGAKKLGAASPQLSKPIPHEFRPITYPATQPYALDEMTRDLLAFAAQHLTLGGRLVFWYPVEPEDTFHPTQLPSRAELRLVAASVHRCKGFTRWLITMERM